MWNKVSLSRAVLLALSVITLFHDAYALSEVCTSDVAEADKSTKYADAQNTYSEANTQCLTLQGPEVDTCDNGLEEFDQACHSLDISASLCSVDYVLTAQAAPDRAPIKYTRTFWSCLPTSCVDAFNIKEITIAQEQQCLSAGFLCGLNFECRDAGQYSRNSGGRGMSTTSIIALSVIGVFVILLVIALAVVIPRRRRQRAYAYHEQGARLNVQVIQAGWNHEGGRAPSSDPAHWQPEYPQPGGGPPVNDQGMPVAFVAAGEDGQQTIYVPTPVTAMHEDAHPASDPPKFAQWPT